MEEASRPVKSSHVRHWLSIAAGTTALLIGLMAWWQLTARDTGPIPRTYAQHVSYPLFYPTRLPAGYMVDRNSFETRDKSVLIFSIKASDGRTIAVAQQAKPPDAPIHSKSSTPIKVPGERTFTTGIGDAYVSLWGDKYVADISTAAGTWIILNVTHFTADEAAAVAQSFTQVR